MRQAPLLALVLLALSPVPALAQGFAKEGDRVRFVMPNGPVTQRVVGTVEASTDSVLVVRDARSGERLEVPRNVVSRLQVSEGMFSSRAGATNGAVVGGSVGFFLGFLTGFALTQGEDGNILSGSLPYAGGGVVAGAVGGALLGSRPRERWRTIPTGRLGSVSPTVAPATGGGTAVGMTLTF